MKNDNIIVPFELALELNRNEFPRKAFGNFYNSSGIFCGKVPSYSLYGPYAPYVSEVRTWLRENYNIKLRIVKKKKFSIVIGRGEKLETFEDIPSYKEAWFKRIKESLKLINET